MDWRQDSVNSSSGLIILKVDMNKLIVTALLGALVFAGCGKNEEGTTAATENASGPMKVRVGYIGLTCEAPIFTAVEKGFFKEENLDVELVKCEWANYKD